MSVFGGTADIAKLVTTSANDPERTLPIWKSVRAHATVKGTLALFMISTVAVLADAPLFSTGLGAVARLKICTRPIDLIQDLGFYGRVASIT